MKTRTKALLLTLCAVLLVTASVMGTMAYLTSTKTVTNTFTVGKVAIKLDEAKVGDDGKALTGEKAGRTEEGNAYHLLPGHEYDKDPTVTVLANSEDSYVRMKVTVTFGKKLDDATLATKLDNIFVGYDKTKWPRYEKNTEVVAKTGEDGTQYTEITYEYRYKDIVTSSTKDQKLDALFESVKVPDEWGNDELEAVGGFTVKVVAEAIQASGFEADEVEKLTAADVAWAAFDKASEEA